jgi:hypothetical protein
MKRLLVHPEAQAWVRSVWEELCRIALDDLAQPSSRLRAALEKPISIVAQALATDVVMQRHIDGVVEHLAHSIIAWRGEIGSFVAEVVAQLGYPHAFRPPGARGRERPPIHQDERHHCRRLCGLPDFHVRLATWVIIPE